MYFRTDARRVHNRRFFISPAAHAAIDRTACCHRVCSFLPANGSPLRLFPRGRRQENRMRGHSQFRHDWYFYPPSVAFGCPLPQREDGGAAHRIEIIFIPQGTREFLLYRKKNRLRGSFSALFQFSSSHFFALALENVLIASSL